MTMRSMFGRLKRFIFRDSATGRFLSKEEFEQRDPATTQKERVDV